MTNKNCLKELLNREKRLISMVKTEGQIISAQTSRESLRLAIYNITGLTHITMSKHQRNLKERLFSFLMHLSA